MLKRLTAACLLSFAGLGAAAQLPDSADMSAGGEFRRRIDRHTSTKAYRMLFVGTPLIVGGVVMQAYDSDFRRLRNGYSPFVPPRLRRLAPVRSRRGDGGPESLRR